MLLNYPSPLWRMPSSFTPIPPSFPASWSRNWAAGVPPEKCSRGTEGHNTASIGGFVMLPPAILGALKSGVEAAQAVAVRHLGLTHESQALAQYAKVGMGRRMAG